MRVTLDLTKIAITVLGYAIVHISTATLGDEDLARQGVFLCDRTHRSPLPTRSTYSPGALEQGTVDTRNAMFMCTAVTAHCPRLRCLILDINGSISSHHQR